MPKRPAACDTHQRNKRDHEEISRRLLELEPVRQKLEQRLAARNPQSNGPLLHDALMDAAKKASEEYEPSASSRVTLQSFFRYLAMQQISNAIGKKRSKKRGGDVLTLNQDQLVMDSSESPTRSWDELLPAGRDDIRIALNAQVSRAISRLTEHEQLIIRLRYWSQLSMAEIAECLSLTESAVRKNLAVARGKMKTSIEAWSIPLSTVATA